MKGQRSREGVFQVLNWLVSIVLAGFLIGFGGLVIGDLPKVSSPVTIEQFMPAGRQAELEAAKQRVETERNDLLPRLEAAGEKRDRAAETYTSAREAFDNWVKTRTATGDGAQDADLVSRTRELDRLKSLEDAARTEHAALSDADTALGEKVAVSDRALEALRTAAEPAYKQARFLQDLKVFLLRLALTLPLLGISAWMLMRRPRGDYWPFKRGFILFSAFAFFVELVPYLPDYGGYVRFGVGILLTIVIGHFLIRSTRAYFAKREADEQKAEPERVQAITYDEALKKIGARTCPGCDRGLPTMEGTQLDYCVHCGLHLFNHCSTCKTRKFAFFRYCMACGSPAAPEGQEG
jgi:hypothetical protein